MTALELAAIIDRRKPIACVNDACRWFGQSPDKFRVECIETPDGLRSFVALCECGRAIEIAAET